MIRQLVSAVVLVIALPYVLNQVRKPTRWVGRFFLWTMNLSHSRLPFPDGTFDLVTAVETHYY